MKKIFVCTLMCCIAVSAALFTSCETKNYSNKTVFIGVVDPASYNTNSAADKAVFEEYLNSKGFKTTGVGEAYGYKQELRWNEDETFMQAVTKVWEPLKAKLSYDEVYELAVSDTFHVTMGVATDSGPAVNWIYPDPFASVHTTCTNNPMSVSTEGVQDAVFVFHCSRRWSATADKDWLTFSPQSGEADQDCTIHVTVAAGPRESARIIFRPRHTTQEHTYIMDIDRE